MEHGILVSVRGGFLFHCRIPVIFDGVVSATRQALGDLGPTVAHAPVSEEQTPFLSLRPLIFFYMRTEMVVPAFPALFANSPYVGWGIPGKFSAITVHF